MSEPIAVRPHDFRRNFDSIEAAVKHAFAHPLAAEAKADAERLTGSRLVDGYWTLDEWNLHFSNHLSLRIWVPATEVRWLLGDRRTDPPDESVCRVGSQPFPLRWPEPFGVRPMDASALLAKRLGSSFQNLHVNHTGLYLYFKGHLVFCFHAAFKVADSRNVVYVYEDN